MRSRRKKIGRRKSIKAKAPLVPPTSEAFQGNQWPHLHCIIVFAASILPSKTSRAEVRISLPFIFSFLWDSVAVFGGRCRGEPLNSDAAPGPDVEAGCTTERQIMPHSPLNDMSSDLSLRTPTLESDCLSGFHF